MTTLDGAVRALRAPEPGTDAYDALDGRPALEYKLALTPDQVREIRDELNNHAATQVALGERYDVPPNVIGNVKHGKAYGWVGSAADGSDDCVPAVAFQLSDAAIDYIRDRGGEMTGLQLADRLRVSESAVSRVLNGSRSGGWRKQSGHVPVFSPTPNMCNVMREALALGLRATEVMAALTGALDLDLPEKWMMNLLFRPSSAAHPQWLALSEAYQERRARLAEVHDGARAEIRASVRAHGGSLGRTLPPEVEVVMLRAVGLDLSPRSICVAAGLVPTRLHDSIHRKKSGVAGGMMGRVAAACERRESERRRYVSAVSRKLSSALKRDRPRLAGPPRPWAEVCRDLFDGAVPDDFSFNRAA